MTNICNVLTLSLVSLTLLFFPFPYQLFYYFILMFDFCELSPIFLFWTRWNIN